MHRSYRDISAEKKLQTALLAEKNFFPTIADCANAIITIIEPDGTMSMLNHYAQQITGYTQAEVASEPYFWRRFLTDAMRKKVETIFKHARQKKVDSQCTNAWLSKSGEEHMFEWANSVVRHNDGSFKFMLSIGIDITNSEHKQKEFETIFNLVRDGIAILDLKNNFLDFNQAYLSMVGYTREELLTKSCIELSVEEDIPRVIAVVEEVITKGFVTNFEKSCHRKDGSVFTINAAIALMPDKKRLLLSSKDVTSMKQHETQLQHIAHHDQLTKLPNRYLLTDMLNQSIKLANNNDKHIAVAYLDLDGFKQVNDLHGHHIGDALLVELSKRMKLILREEDAIARLGGDEFVIVFTNLISEESLKIVIDPLLIAASTPAILNEQVVSGFSASIGVTFYPQNADVDGDTLLRQADHAMYEAKLRGKNQIVYYPYVSGYLSRLNF